MTGAFRDGSAALERAAMLEQENAELREELVDLARLRVEVGEVTGLRDEIAKLRAVARSENEHAYMKRLGEERDDLQTQVRELRATLALQNGELARLRLKLRMAMGTAGIGGVFQALFKSLSPK